MIILGGSIFSVAFKLRYSEYNAVYDRLDFFSRLR